MSSIPLKRSRKVTNRANKKLAELYSEYRRLQDQDEGDPGPSQIVSVKRSRKVTNRANKKLAELYSEYRRLQDQDERDPGPSQMVSQYSDTISQGENQPQKIEASPQLPIK